MTMNAMLGTFSILFGCVLGSFLNVCIYRIPRKKSIIFPPSSCPHCNERIRFYDNIPLVSYGILGGRCRTCREPIPVLYPLVETISGLLSFSLFMKYGLGGEYVVFFMFSAALVVISFIDLRHQIIPDIISLPGIPLGVGVTLVFGHIPWHNSLGGILAGGGSLYCVALIFKQLTGKEGMGGGDIKLLAMIGAWMGWKALPCIILVSSLTGAVIGSLSLLLSKKGLRARIPFGPFLALGALVYLFFGAELVSWYLGLFML